MSAWNPKPKPIVPFPAPTIPFVESVHDIAARIAALPTKEERRRALQAHERRHGLDDRMRERVLAAWNERREVAA